MPIKQILRRGRKKPLFVAGEATREVDLRRDEIIRMVPHREPFLFVERISAVDLVQNAIRGHRRIDPGDPVLAGHFPGEPVYPGALLLETLGQICVCLYHFCARGRVEVGLQDEPPRLRLVRLHHALFSEEIRPGDEVTLIGKQVEDNGLTSLFAAQALKGDQVCTLAVMEVLILDAPEVGNE